RLPSPGPSTRDCPCPNHDKPESAPANPAPVWEGSARYPNPSLPPRPLCKSFALPLGLCGTRVLLILLYFLHFQSPHSSLQPFALWPTHFPLIYLVYLRLAYCVRAQ